MAALAIARMVGGLNESTHNEKSPDDLSGLAINGLRVTRLNGSKEHCRSVKNLPTTFQSPCLYMARIHQLLRLSCVTFSPALSQLKSSNPLTRTK